MNSRDCRRPRPKLLLFLFWGLLSLEGWGCAVGPDYRPPALATPASWHAVATEQPPDSRVLTEPASLQQWWDNFGDPQLSSLIRRALVANLDLQQATARIREARAALGVAGGWLWPEIEVTARHQRSSSGLGGGTGSPMSVGTGGFRDFFQVGLDAAWELDLFGGRRRAVEAAGAELRAAVEDQRAVLVSLTGEVGTNYVILRGLQEQLRIAKDNLKVQEKTAEITRKRYQAGFVSGLDVANAQALVATTAAQIPQLEAAIQQIIYNLSVLLGQPPAALQEELLTPKAIPPVPPEIPVGLPSDLLRRRPDIRRAEAQLQAATARVGVAVAELFPKFFLTGSVGLAGSELQQLGRLKSNYWSFGPTVSWPLFAGGRLRWQVKLQEAVAEQVRLQYEKTVLTAFQEVESALVAYLKEQEHRRRLEEAVRNNRRALELAMQQYISGRTDFLNVLNAERSLYATEEALTLSTRTMSTNLIALYKALGGGWEEQ